MNHKFSLFANDLIGIQSRVEELENLLKLSSKDDNFLVLGIYGISKIGKIIHVTILYDRISYQFDAYYFIENIGKFYRDSAVIVVYKKFFVKV